jgi:hypothetical protein
VTAALHIRFPDISPAALERELGRELEARRALYARRLETHRMLPAEAERELAIAAAWREDLARIRAAWIETPGTIPAPPAHQFSWKDRRAALMRELDQRRRFYPEWIAKSRLTQAAADHQVECLECLLAVYEDGWDWRGSDGLTPLHSATADAEFTALHTEIAQRNGRAQQQMELA